ncbi:MAG: hypothetical protein ACI4UC_01360 [Alloprevotella sp.]
MKKKNYTAPHMEVIEVASEGMIAESIRIGTSEGNQQLSHGKGWDCADWETTEESEE